MTASEPEAAQVADYLARHPDFLQQHPQLLETLTLSDADDSQGNVASFQAFHVRSLQQSLSRMQQQQRDFVHNARANLGIVDGVHQCVLSIIGQPSLEDVYAAVQQQWANLLQVPHALLAVEKERGCNVPTAFVALPPLPQGTVQRLLGAAVPAAGQVSVLLTAHSERSRLLFGSDGMTVASDAVVVLRPCLASPLVVLALGASEAGAFHPEQGTDFLRFLGQSLQQVIAGWLRR